MNHDKAQPPRLYVGTYTDPALLGEDRGVRGRAKGIYRLAFDGKTGALTQEALFEGIVNPAFLALSGDGGRLYCAHELDTFRGEPGGAVSAYRVSQTKGLVPLNTERTHGEAPCHVSLRPDGRMLAAANYGGGSLSVFPLAEDGSIGPAQCVRYAGHGPNAQRQASSHVHSSHFTTDGRYVVAADLGTDALTATAVGDTALYTDDVRVTFVEPGDGPRMCRWDAARGLLYVACELTCRIAVLACGADGVPTAWRGAAGLLPEGTPLEGASAADLALGANGRFLYASCRGHDSLTVYAIAEDGALSLIQNIPCGGKTPRAFTLSPDGRWLLCGNQDSDDITVFAIDSEKGTLSPRARCEVPSPVCLVFAPPTR